MSSYFVWDPDLFDLKIPDMDQEHLHLISLMNLLFEKNQSSNSKNELLKVINDLLDFVVLHFKNEEAFMEKIRFPGLPNHHTIHQRLLSQLKQHKQDFEEDPSGKINERFFDFLALWLTAHIQHFDKEYSLWTEAEQKS